VPRTLLLALALTACSGNSGSEKELTDIRAELTDQRAEMRAMRQEIRELRDELHKTTPDEPAAEPAAEPPAADSTTPPTSPPSGAAQPGKPAKPPAQGSVNIEVESNPPGAAVYLADKKVGVTPVIMKVPTGTKEINMRLEKSGYRPRLMTLRPEEDTKMSVQLAKKSE
jgi:uncharacterized coiled-coil protein SlyX